jgi:hypothetical protein
LQFVLLWSGLFQRFRDDFFYIQFATSPKNRTSPELFERDDAVGTTGGATLATGVEVFGNICAQEALNVILT